MTTPTPGAVPRAVSAIEPLYGPRFEATIGSPAKAILASRWPVMAYDDTASETAAHEVEVPAFWTSMHVDLIWSVFGTPAPGADTVRWIVNIDHAGEGEPLNVSSGGGTVIAPIVAPGQFLRKKSRVFTARPVAAGKSLNIRVQREGSHAEDTLVGDAALIVVKLTRAGASHAVDL